MRNLRHHFILSFHLCWRVVPSPLSRRCTIYVSRDLPVKEPSQCTWDVTGRILRTCGNAGIRLEEEGGAWSRKGWIASCERTTLGRGGAWKRALLMFMCMLASAWPTPQT